MKKKIFSFILVLTMIITNINITSAAQNSYKGLEVFGHNPYGKEIIITPGDNVAQQVYNSMTKNPFLARQSYGVLANLDENNNIIHHSYLVKGSTEYKVGKSASDWNGITFTSGNYDLYALTRYTDQNKFFYRHIYNIFIKIAYTMNVSVSGFNGGGIIFSGQNYNAGSNFYYEPTSNLSFKVQDIKSYDASVTFNGTKLKPNASGTYTISKDVVKQATDKKIYINYSLQKGKESKITLSSDAAIITFNGSTQTSQTVAQGYTYNVSAVAKDGYEVNGILLDGEKVISGTSGTIDVTKGSHTISVDAIKTGIYVHDGIIDYRENMSKQTVAKAIFNAIYDSSSYPAWSFDKIVLDGGIYISGHFIEFYGPDVLTGMDFWNGFYTTSSSFLGTLEYWKTFGQKDIEKVRLRHYELEGYTPKIDKISNEANLVLKKIRVSLKNTNKEYTGSPCNIDSSISNNSDLIWNGNVSELTNLEIIGYYDDKFNSLSEAPTNVGTYYIKVRATDNIGYNTSDFIKFNIVPKDISSLVDVKILGEYIYDSTSKIPNMEIKVGNKVLQKDKDVKISYSNSNGGADNVTNAGTVTVTLDFIGNYKGQAKRTYVIKPADATISIADATKIYDKKPVSVEYTTTHKDEIKDNVTVEYKKQNESDDKYTTEAPVNEGNYIVRISVSSTSNYNKTDNTTREFSIKKKEVVLSGYKLEKVYDGKSQGQLSDIIIGNIDNKEVGDDVTLDLSDAIFTLDNKTVDATSVTVENAKLIGEDAKNYSLPETIVWEATVKPRKVTIQVEINDKQYDGTNKAKIKNAVLDNVVEQDTIDVSYEDIEAQFLSELEGDNIGVVLTGNFKLLGDEDILKNYILIQPHTDTEEDSNTDPSIFIANIYNTYIPESDKDFTININEDNTDETIVKAANGYELSLNNTDEGPWLSVLKTTENDINFYVRKKETKDISQKVSIQTEEVKKEYLAKIQQEEKILNDETNSSKPNSKAEKNNNTKSNGGINKTIANNIETKDPAMMTFYIIALICSGLLLVLIYHRKRTNK